MKNFKVISSVAAVLIFGLVFSGCGRWGWHNKSPEKKIAYVMEKISSELDLTSEQQIKLEGIKNAIVTAVKEAKKDQDKIHSDAIALVRKDKITNAEVEEFFNIREAKYRILKPVLVEQFKQFHAMLTPEQREKFAVIAEKHYNKREK